MFFPKYIAEASRFLITTESATGNAKNRFTKHMNKRKEVAISKNRVLKTCLSHQLIKKDKY